MNQLTSTIYASLIRINLALRESVEFVSKNYTNKTKLKPGFTIIFFIPEIIYVRYKRFQLYQKYLVKENDIQYNAIPIH